MHDQNLITNSVLIEFQISPRANESNKDNQEFNRGLGQKFM